MNEYSQRRTVVEDDVPIKRARPVVETKYDSVVREERGMSGGAIAALVLGAIAAAVVITMLILNSQQKNTDDQLAQERARAAAAQQATAQQPAQQPAQAPPVVIMPSSPMPAVTTPVTPPPATETAPSSAQVEIDVTSALLNDPDLRSFPIDVKVAGRTAMLSGHVPSDDLKIRAERLARTIKGVGKVVNSITVEP